MAKGKFGTEFAWLEAALDAGNKKGKPRSRKAWEEGESGPSKLKQPHTQKPGAKEIQEVCKGANLGQKIIEKVRSIVFQKA